MRQACGGTFTLLVIAGLVRLVIKLVLVAMVDFRKTESSHGTPTNQIQCSPWRLLSASASQQLMLHVYVSTSGFLVCFHSSAVISSFVNWASKLVTSTWWGLDLYARTSTIDGPLKTYFPSYVFQARPCYTTHQHFTPFYMAKCLHSMDAHH